MNECVVQLRRLHELTNLSDQGLEGLADTEHFAETPGLHEERETIMVVIDSNIIGSTASRPTTA